MATDPPSIEWLLTATERGNAQTTQDDRHDGDQAWSRGNLVRPLIDGATYFAELYERLEETKPGDLVYFTDWHGEADQQLTDDPDSEVSHVLGRADERGVDVRGLVWRSHHEAFGFNHHSNRLLGKKLQKRGAEALLDMRVRLGGSHHQKLVVIRHGDDPTRDIAYVGGIDLAHSRRDDAAHRGDPQVVHMATEYGKRPPWHDIQAAIEGPAVYDVETVFRERWLDPTPLSRNPVYYWRDHFSGMDVSPDPLPDQAPPPPPVDEGEHVVQLLRTYPNLRFNRDYPFAHGGERSVARGYTKALDRAERLVYVEDQYFWGHHVGRLFADILRKKKDLRVIVLVPMYTDVPGRLGRIPQLMGRQRAMDRLLLEAPDRVAFYCLENEESTPIYVHAKCCIMDDTWTTIGSDNFNLRSWTHDSELSAVVVDQGEKFARKLRLRLAAEHLGRDLDSPDAVADCVDPIGMFDTYAASAARLDEWHAGGQNGERPPGRLRRLEPPDLSSWTKLAYALPYRWGHDQDGRPRPKRTKDVF